MFSPLIARAPAAERAALTVCVMLLAAAAWLAMWLSGDSGLFHMHHLDRRMLIAPSFFLYFLAGWTVMTAAMMLPTTAPVLATLHSFAAGRRDRALLIALAIIGYLLVWAVAGAAAYAGYLGVLAITEWSAWAARYSAYGPAVVLLTAGAFQFSRLKYQCLDKCRSPFTFAMSYWQGERERYLSFRLGVDHGLYCVGCCWALMLLMFATGTASLAWMMALAILMAVEKNAPWGRRLSAPLGLVLLAWGALLIFR